MTASGARAFLSAGSAVLLVVSGCTVSEPDANEWRDHAVQTLEDVASEVATTRLTLVQLDKGRLPSSYGVTVMADSETALSTAEESLSSLQPPPGLGTRADRVLTLVGRAADVVQQARENVVAGKFHVPTLLAQLARLQRALERRKTSL